MRHGIPASLTFFALVCLAVGDEPKRLDRFPRSSDTDEAQPDEIPVHGKAADADETDENRNEKALPERVGTVLDLDEPVKQIEHIRIAAKHLKAAGMHDLAVDLMEKAEAMEREVGEVKKRKAKQEEDRRRKLDETLEQIEVQWKEIQRNLQQRLEELQKLQESKPKELCPLMYEDYLGP